jgi:hypothetical protein
MLGVFRRMQRRETPRLPRRRLNLERLDGRDVPSLLTLSITPSGVDKMVTVNGDLRPDTAAFPPARSGSFAALVTYQTVHLDGAVDGTNVAGQIIDLGGVVDGIAVTDASGHFTRTLQAVGLGTATARTADGSSNIATATLMVAPPNIDVLLAVEEPTDWVISGHVTGCKPGSLTITLSGLASVRNMTVTVDAKGNFATAVHLNGTAQDDGWLRAVTSDIWGQTSNEALYLVCQTH